MEMIVVQEARQYAKNLGIIEKDLIDRHEETAPVSWSRSHIASL